MPAASIFQHRFHGKRANNMSVRPINPGPKRKRVLPTDLEPGEAELLAAFDTWLHKTYPNPGRIGCPGILALAELVVADSKFDDEYTLRHIGECAACVDDITALNADFQWMKDNFK
jgi:hypothetical protein